MSVTAYTAVKGDKRVVMRIYEFMLSLNLQMHARLPCCFILQMHIIEMKNTLKFDELSNFKSISLLYVDNFDNFDNINI